MLNIQHLTKQYQQQTVVNHINCTLATGTITALLGPSGSGKSTLMRCIAGLTQPDSGQIFFQNQNLSEIPSHKIGMVFQAYHLFPHFCVLENLTYAPIKLGHLGELEAKTKAQTLLQQFGLADKSHHFPNQLSGGQKQRVAIARALMLEPQILLFDEPTSALDPEMVTDVAELISDLRQPNRLIIIATHELKVAKKIADHVLFMEDGHLVENDPCTVFFTAPKSQRAQLFLDRMS
jgi:arginine/lysine/histidine transport system ATP-binding protein